MFAVGYRLADAESDGRLDVSRYDLLASEARLASFLAIAKGDVPESHWFHLGRAVTAVHGAPVLLSWSATLFEYLMPLLVTRTYPGTLLDESCRMAVRRQIDYGAKLGVPWGISESAYSAVDRHGTYQYKAFGVPGLGLKRGLGDELVVAPYATALAAMLVPAQSAQQPEAARGAGPRGRLRILRRRRLHRSRAGRRRATPTRTAPGHRPHLHGAPPGHDARGAGQRAARRPHGRRAFTPTRACRPPSCCCRSGGRATCRPRNAGPLDDVRSRRRRRPRRCAGIRTPHTVFPHAQFLSNGRLVSVVTNAGGGSLMRDGAGGDAIAPRCHARSRQHVHLPARRLERRRLVADLPTRRRSSRTTTS